MENDNTLLCYCDEYVLLPYFGNAKYLSKCFEPEFTKMIIGGQDGYGSDWKVIIEKDKFYITITALDIAIEIFNPEMSKRYDYKCRVIVADIDRLRAKVTNLTSDCFRDYYGNSVEFKHDLDNTNQEEDMSSSTEAVKDMSEYTGSTDEECKLVTDEDMSEHAKIIGEGYRLLLDNEVIEKGFEYYDAVAEEWKPAPDRCLGKSLTEITWLTVYFRRPLSDEHEKERNKTVADAKSLLNMDIRWGDLTCDGCGCVAACEFRYDLYNTNGDCLDMK